MQALTRQVARRISRRWPHMDNDVDREDMAAALWFEAERLWHSHNPEFGNTYREYAWPLLCAHATDYARQQSSQVAPKSRDYRDQVVGVGGAYDCVGLAEEGQHDEDEETCRPKSRPLTRTVDPTDPVETSQTGDAVRAIAGDDPDLSLLLDLANGAACKDLAGEFYGATGQSQIQLVAKRRDRALARLRLNEDLRDIHAARFGRDKHRIDYAPLVAAEAFAGWAQALARPPVDQPSTTASRAQGAARSKRPPFRFHLPCPRPRRGTPHPPVTRCGPLRRPAIAGIPSPRSRRASARVAMPRAGPAPPGVTGVLLAA